VVVVLDDSVNYENVGKQHSHNTQQSKKIKNKPVQQNLVQILVQISVLPIFLLIHSTTMHPSPAVISLSRRSLTAYSIYFQEERRRLLQEPNEPNHKQRKGTIGLG